jgi:replicative superfamily II helicase
MQSQSVTEPGPAIPGQQRPALDMPQRCGVAAAPISLRNPPKAGVAVVAAVNPTQLAIQLIALSATMGNVDELAQWMGGAIFRTSFRPVPLLEHVKAGTELLDPQGKVLATLPPPAPAVRSSAAGPGLEADSDHLLLLCDQALRRGQQVLIFCPSKFTCVQTCKHLLAAFRATAPGTAPQPGPHKPSSSSTRTITHLAEKKSAAEGWQQQLTTNRRALVEALVAASPGADEALRDMLLLGVAYHNAGTFCCVPPYCTFASRSLIL